MILGIDNLLIRIICTQYTVLIRDRALVADKGYIVRAERVTA